MSHAPKIKEGMDVIGADGVSIGHVDGITHHSIQLNRKASGMGAHEGHHHYLPLGLVAEVEGHAVRLSATAANALAFLEEKDGAPVDSAG